MHNFRRIAAGFLVVTCLLAWGGRLTAAADAPSEILLEGLLVGREVVDLAGQGLSVEALSGVYTELLYGMPELFHVAPRLSYSTRGGEVEAVYPVYTLEGEALTAARSFYRNAITAILARMEAAFGGRTPEEAEVVLYLHDYLADRYAYDTRRESSNADAYSFLRDGVGVCQAYALAFMALARGAGLEADFVASAAMDHAWNHVRVDGVWYHVDVTRDDPIPAAEGREEVNHARLLRSDEGMEALGYYGYACSAGHTCGDTRFEEAGVGSLTDFHRALIPAPAGGRGGGAEGAPVAITVGEQGFSTGQGGDLDRDEKITPADLLCIYDEGEYDFEAWREWVREALVE